MIKIIDFWAPWCNPCRIMEPVLAELEKELAGKIEIVKINVDENSDQAQKYGVMSIPTYVIEKEGQEIGRKVGVTPKQELLKLIHAQ